MRSEHKADQIVKVGRNVAYLIIEHGFLPSRDNSFTCREIAEKTGLRATRVGYLLKHYTPAIAAAMAATLTAREDGQTVLLTRVFRASGSVAHVALVGVVNKISGAAVDTTQGD